MAVANTQKYSVKVPLGSKSGEEKGSTKIVRRKLSGLKGSKPKRKGIVFWRGEHFNVSEVADNEGHFIVGTKAKKGDVPQDASKPKAKTTTKKTETKKGKAKSKGGGKSAKESDSRKRAA